MDISPVEIDDALVIEDDDISDDEDDDHDDVCYEIFLVSPSITFCMQRLFNLLQPSITVSKLFC